MATQYAPFEQALDYGHQAEQRIVEVFQRAGCKAWPVDERHRTDIILLVGRLPWWVEVKNEDRKANTGNLCIEYAQGREPRVSGIFYSLSHRVIHTLGADAVVYDRLMMRSFVHANASHWKDIIAGDNYARMFIVPIRLLPAGAEWWEKTQVDLLPKSRLFQ